MGNYLTKHFYNFFLICTSIGALGEYIYLAALNWFIVEEFNSADILGILFFFRILPRFFIGYVGGFLADKYNKKYLIIIIYAGILLSSLLQTTIIFFSDDFMWKIVAGTMFFRSIFDGAEPGVRNAILPDLIKGKNMTKAIGYYSSGLNIAAIIAPLIAVFLTDLIGIKYIFWIDSFLQVPSLFVLFFLPKLTNNIVTKAKNSFKLAFLHIKNTPCLRNYIILSSFFMFIIFPFGTLLSVYVKEGLQLSMNTYGVISGIESCGAVLGGIIIGKITLVYQRKYWSYIGLCSCLLLICLGFITGKWGIYLVIFLLGFSMQLFRSISRVLFHENIPDHIRGKVISIAISDSGFVSLGVLLYTSMVDKFDICTTFIIMGITGVLVTIIFKSLFHKTPKSLV